MSNHVKALQAYFATVELTTEKGTKLRVVSDGRAGNGVTHWRAVYVGETLEAGLSGDRGHSVVSLRPPGREDLRGGPRHEFGTMAEAVKFLLETL